MKKINLAEQKKIMVDILAYIDEVCKKNNIKYSLIGGSLIGAVRHKGFVPWDDDVDIVLMPKEYKKLIKLLSSRTDRYYLINPISSDDFPYPFAKLIDSYTFIEEKDLKEAKDYGVYVDIFKFYYVSNLKIARRINYFGLILRKKAIRIRAQGVQKIKGVKSCFRNLIYFVLRLTTVSRIKKGYIKRTTNSKATKYISLDWPAYGFEHEIQLAKNTEEYIDAEFEGLKVMIFKNYDEILRTTFGDYMQLPPESERVPKHGMKAWWREGYEDEAEKLKRELKKDEMDGEK